MRTGNERRRNGNKGRSKTGNSLALLCLFRLRRELLLRCFEVGVLSNANPPGGTADRRKGQNARLYLLWLLLLLFRLM